MRNLTTIEIFWQGPMNESDIKRLNTGKDYGLYQIYGTHNIFGANTLLYIGQANDQTFATRIAQHKEWLEWGYSDTQFFIGRLGGVEKINNEEWAKNIDIAERLLIYHCSPPYNTKNLNDYGDIKQTLVLNFGKKNVLPLEVSTLYNESAFCECRKNWKEYSLK